MVPHSHTSEASALMWRVQKKNKSKLEWDGEEESKQTDHKSFMRGFFLARCSPFIGVIFGWYRRGFSDDNLAGSSLSMKIWWATLANKKMRRKVFSQKLSKRDGLKKSNDDEIFKNKNLRVWAEPSCNQIVQRPKFHLARSRSFHPWRRFT